MEDLIFLGLLIGFAVLIVIADVVVYYRDKKKGKEL